MALQKTAHDACSRKVHCVSKGYLDDPFVAFFVKDQTIVNSPMMNRGTWLRTTAIENCVLSFAEKYGAPIQVISFGAGVDTLYFRLRRGQPNLPIARFLELDLADLVMEKQNIIQKKKELNSLVGPEYHLVASDLRDTSGLQAILKQHALPGVPTILLAEMVFVYLEETITTEVLRATVQDFFGHPSSPIPIMLITYDAMNPNDRFGEMMCENLHRFGVDLKGIQALPTPEAHEERCKRVGFKTVRVMSMRKLYLTVPQETQTKFHKLEILDDWDEWNIMHDHYCFLVASTDDFSPSIF